MENMEETEKQYGKKVPKNPIKFSIQLSDEQKIAKSIAINTPVSIFMGMVGSGKTLTACQIALDLLFRADKSKIVITRPTVGTEDNGFLPGTFQEKMEPWMIPIKDNLRKVYNKPDKLKSMESDGTLELVSLAHFRGRTFDDCVCIVDEFQNLTKSQLTMAIGRLGKNSIMIFCGDNKQIDLRYPEDSAVHLIHKFTDCKYVYVTSFTENHRHPALTEILNCLDKK